MRKSEFLSKTVVTREMVEKAMARQRFRTARFKLCEKMGWVKDYWKFIGNRDVNAYGTPEKKEFYRKVTRFLAFNYAIHRCPDWLDEPRLWPANREGAQPIIYPPEYKHLQMEG